MEKTTSIFTDDSGARRWRVVWAFRVAAALFVAAVSLVLVSAIGHVALPGLDAPLNLPGADSAAPPASQADQPPRQQAAPSPDAARVARRSAKGDPTQAADRSSRVDDPAGKERATTSPPIRISPANPDGVTPSPTGPAPTATSKPRGKPADKPTSAADPVHSPGTPPAEPPGKAKKDDGSS